MRLHRAGSIQGLAAAGPGRQTGPAAGHFICGHSACHAATSTLSSSEPSMPRHARPIGLRSPAGLPVRHGPSHRGQDAGARPRLTAAAAAVDVLASRVKRLRQDAPLLQRASHLFAALPRRATERHAVHVVEGDESALGLSSSSATRIAGSSSAWATPVWPWHERGAAAASSGLAMVYTFEGTAERVRDAGGQGFGMRDMGAHGW